MNYINLGIISLTEIDNDIRMWAYYASSHNGFLVNFSVEKIKNLFMGPFPIIYTEKFNQIDISKFKSHIPLFYQSTVKSINWEHEKEWRFIAQRHNMKLPKPFDNNNSMNRNFPYDSSVVSEVLLGCNFLNIEKYEYLENFKFRYFFNKDDNMENIKLAILNQIYLNYSDKIKCMTCNEKKPLFVLEKIPITINKIEDNIFEIEYQKQ